MQPGEPGYAEALDRIARIMREEAADVREIRRMSENSFRVWLAQVVDRVASTLGWAVGVARAAVADYLAIAANAGSAFREGFRDAYREARQIERR